MQPPPALTDGGLHVLEGDIAAPPGDHAQCLLRPASQGCKGLRHSYTSQQPRVLLNLHAAEATVIHVTQKTSMAFVNAGVPTKYNSDTWCRECNHLHRAT